MRRWLANTPWWVVSAGIHITLLLGATLVYLEELVAFYTPDSFVISTRTTPREGGFASMPIVSDQLTSRGPVEDDFTPATTEEWLHPPYDKEESRPPGGDGGSLPSHGVFRCSSNDRSRREPNFCICPPASNSQSCVVNLHGRPPEIARRSLLRPKVQVPIGGGSTTLAGLRWLARHQNADGGWSARDYSTRCRRGTCPGGGESEFDTGVTGLALLSFLGAGYSQLSKDLTFEPDYTDQPLNFGQTVKSALQWLLAHQDPEGCIGDRGPKHLYNHAIAALALSEAYGMTAAAPLKDPAQKAIDFLVAAQNPGSGWRYSYRAGDNDTAVTGWAVMALKSAELSELSFPQSAYAGALSWLDQVTDPNDSYRCGYNGRGTGKVSIPGRNEAWDDHPTMTAVSILSRIFMHKTKSAPLGTAAQLLVSDLPAWNPGQVDFVYWYYGSLAIFQYDGPGGPLWKRWNESMKNAVVPSQRTAAHGCQSGSWDPSVDRWGLEGGRVYATAINTLSLECYYIYTNVFSYKQ